MKCNVATGMKLEQFKDIKVGPYQSEVVYGSPSYEPYPDLSKAAQYQLVGLTLDSLPLGV